MWKEQSSRAMWKAPGQCGKLNISNVHTGKAAADNEQVPGNTLDKNLSFCGINLYVNPLEALRRKTL
jgi:hypothetical protein